MRGRVLHLLSQRPSLTGSGVTLEALVTHAGKAGWEQHAVVGVPAGEAPAVVADLPPERIHPLRFGEGELAFPVPGMSDVMPYPSTRFSEMSEGQLAAYRGAWRRHLERVLAAAEPDVVHSHHLWLLSALIKDVAPGVPVVTHGHGTGLRQMTLCPHLAGEVRSGCRRNERFTLLHRAHARAVAETLEVPPERVEVVGAGYREDLFHPPGGSGERGATLLYVGKLSAAKGLPWLLEAFEQVRARRPEVELHAAGAGAGAEAEELARRMAVMPGVTLHGQLAQPELAVLMRRAAVCVLPSFYEGLPLVRVEAAACGCRLVATELPGVMEELAPHLGELLEAVPLPRLASVDTPVPAELPVFVDRLAAALGRALDRSPAQPPPEALEPFTWAAVFRRVEAVWHTLVPGSRR